MHDHVSITIECILGLLRYAHEIPSAEYILVDDGSVEVCAHHHTDPLSVEIVDDVSECVCECVVASSNDRTWSSSRSF